ncbi:hypothetical protein JCM11641_005713 [Rhodosporidiobolus odoratus]
MSLSDLTRSLTTIPGTSASASPTSIASSLSTLPPSYSPTPVIPSILASLGSSNVAGYSIAAVESAANAQRTDGRSGGTSGGVNQGLALGLGLGLGLAALFGALAAVLITRQRRAQRVEFDQRAQAIRTTMQEIKASEAGKAADK